MRSSTNKVKTSSNNNKEPEYDTDFTEYNESNTKLKPTTTKAYSSRTPSSDGGGGGGKNEKTTNKNTNNNNNNKSRAYSSDSRSNSSRSISRSVSKSRSLSPANKNANKPNTKQKNGNNNNNNNNKISNIKARSTDIYDSSRKKDYKSSKYSDIYPSYNAQKRKPGLNNKSNQKRNNQRNDSIPPMAPDTLGQAALRVMSAQRHKNTDLQNRITELNLELDKLKDENKTLKRIHMREEIAIKRFESQDYDLNRIMRNHTEESNSLKEQIKKIKLENRRLNSNLIEKEEEVRSIRKKNEEFKQILNDKKLLDSVELSKSLEQAEKDLQELKIKFDNQERKIEMMEKNHKHELGVELAHHKEVQRNLIRLNEENRELKVKLEEKERALDISNIYSNRNNNVNQPTTQAGAQPVSLSFKTSLNTLNSSPFETPRDKRKETDRKKKETKPLKPSKEEQHYVKDEAKTTKSILNENELKAQKEDAQLKMQEIEMKIKQQEAELKRKDAAERQKREQQQKDDEERIKQMQKQKKLDEEKKRLEEEKHKKQQQQQQNDDIFNRNKLNADEEEKKRKEKELLEEEDRKKRWISTNTVNNVKLSDEKEKNSLEKSKKDELLAKLALLDTGSNLNTNTNNDIIASTGLKQPKSDQNLLSFGSTNNNSSLPPKPFQFTNNNNNTEYKFTNTIENLHDGKPVSINREQSNSNKNDLLNKLFNNNNNSSNNNNNNDVDFSLNNNRYQQSKLDKIDDIFTNKTTHDKVKSNVMPWELDTVIKKQETNGFDHSSSLNRPKLDNKSLFNNNNNNDNYVEDIEELAL